MTDWVPAQGLAVSSRYGERLSAVWGAGRARREEDIDTEASFWLGVDGEGGVMGLGDGGDDGQAKAKAFCFGGPGGG